MVLTKYLLILLDKPNIKFEVLELYKLTQVQNFLVVLNLILVVLELYKLTQVQNQIQKDSFDYIVLELYDLI